MKPEDTRFTRKSAIWAAASPRLDVRLEQDLHALLVLRNLSLAYRQLLGGSAAGMVVKRQRKGRHCANLALGTGAIIGGAVFHIFSLFATGRDFDLPARSACGVLGSLLVLAVFWAWQRYGRRGVSVRTASRGVSSELRSMPADRLMLSTRMRC